MLSVVSSWLCKISVVSVFLRESTPETQRRSWREPTKLTSMSKISKFWNTTFYLINIEILRLISRNTRSTKVKRSSKGQKNTRNQCPNTLYPTWLRRDTQRSSMLSETWTTHSVWSPFSQHSPNINLWKSTAKTRRLPRDFTRSGWPIAQFLSASRSHSTVSRVSIIK